MDSAFRRINPDIFCCNDCGHDTKQMGERYMVKDYVWEEALSKERFAPHMLCIKCLERRIGYRLTPDHFIYCGLNMREHYYQSLLLRSRIRWEFDED